ncbi:uncharacterized protein ACO6RY_08330 [Pungitius sinensis]
MAGTHSLVAHYSVAMGVSFFLSFFLLPRVTSGRFFPAYKSAQPGDAHNVKSLSAQRLSSLLFCSTRTIGEHPSDGEHLEGEAQSAARNTPAERRAPFFFGLVERTRVQTLRNAIRSLVYTGPGITIYAV